MTHQQYLTFASFEKVIMPNRSRSFRVSIIVLAVYFVRFKINKPLRSVVSLDSLRTEASPNMLLDILITRIMLEGICVRSVLRGSRGGRILTRRPSAEGRGWICKRCSVAGERSLFRIGSIRSLVL